MNLAELIINTIHDEAAKTRQLIDKSKQEILDAIKNGDSRTFLEQEVGEALNKSSLSFVSEPLIKRVNPCQQELASRKAPNAAFDERDMDDWVRANFYKCTKIIELSRRGDTARQIANTLNERLSEKKYTQSNIYQIKSMMKKYGFMKGMCDTVSATDKLRSFRP